MFEANSVGDSLKRNNSRKEDKLDNSKVKTTSKNSKNLDQKLTANNRNQGVSKTLGVDAEGINSHNPYL